MVSHSHDTICELGVPLYLPNERFDPTCTAVDLVESDFADDLGAVLSVGCFGSANPAF